MKNKNNFNFSRFSNVSFDEAKVVGLIVRNYGKSLMSIYIKIWIAIKGTISPSAVRLAKDLLKANSHIAKTQGPKGLVKFQKSLSVVIQQSLGGHTVSDLSLIGPRLSRTRSGFPRVIPGYARVMILRDHNFAILKFVLSISALYRVIVYPGQLKLKSITAPSIGTGTIRLNKWIPVFCKHFLKGFSKPYWANISDLGLFPIFKSSPNSLRDGYSSFPMSVIESFWALLSKDLVNPIMILANFLNARSVVTLIQSLKTLFPKVSELSSEIPLGKLGLKLEAAGKVRVFAMVDPITQWVLYPIHRFIFEIIKRQPMDGTFNQTKVLERSFGWKSKYSLDLSSATDRLPIALQRQLIGQIFGKTISKI